LTLALPFAGVAMLLAFLLGRLGRLNKRLSARGALGPWFTHLFARPGSDTISFGVDVSVQTRFFSHIIYLFLFCQFSARQRQLPVFAGGQFLS
jgi:hypothetical protein